MFWTEEEYSGLAYVALGYMEQAPMVGNNPASRADIYAPEPNPMGRGGS